jgi:hypothetical protein
MWQLVTRLLSLTGATGSALTSAAASICCIGPAGIALLGVEGAILAAGIKPYRGYLLTGSLLLLGAAFWSVYGRTVRSRGSCPVRAGKVVRSILWVSLGIWVAAVVIQFAADRYWL